MRSFCGSPKTVQPGCTIFGEPQKERIQFNEDSLWVGNEDCTGGYQPFGDVYVEMPHSEYSDYRRELDISRAVQTVTYTVGRRADTAASTSPAIRPRSWCSASRPTRPAALSGKVSLGNVHEIPIAADRRNTHHEGRHQQVLVVAGSP